MTRLKCGLTQENSRKRLGRAESRWPPQLPGWRMVGQGSQLAEAGLCIHCSFLAWGRARAAALDPPVTSVSPGPSEPLNPISGSENIKRWGLPHRV